MKMKVLLTRAGKIHCMLILIVHCLKVIGLAPFSLSYKPSAGRSENTLVWVVEFSKIGMGYNVFISILLPSTAIFSFYKLSTVDYTNKSLFTQVCDLAQGYLMVGTAFISLISWTFKQRKAVNIINRLLEINVRLSCMEIQPSHKKSSILLLVHFAMNVFLWASMLAVTSSIYTDNTFSKWIFAALPGFVIFCNIIEYSMILGFVTTELESVNQNLLNMKKIRNYASPDPLLNIYRDALILPNSNQRNVLLLLRNLRTTLFEISRDINNFFSFPMLPCFAHSFFALVCNFYYSIIPFVLPNKSLSIESACVGIIWIAISIYPVVWLLFNATETVSEAKLTGQIVHKLLTSSAEKEIKSELQIFSLQLLHEDFSFTAHGFFTLDFTTLHMMIGAAATYIIICIQLQ